MPIDQVHCSFEVRHAHHRQHRAEDFFLVDGHFRLDAVEKAAAQEKAVFMTFHFQPAAINDQLRTFFDTQRDVAGDLVEMLSGDQRTHFRGAVGTGIDPEVPGALGEFLHQFVGDPADRDCDGDGHAALARRAVGRAGQRIHGLVEIGVRHYHQAVLAPPSACTRLPEAVPVR
jgi:hypothetical protein